MVCEVAALYRHGASVADFLLRPRSLILLLCGSFVLAMAFCLVMFDFSFLLGTAIYWQAPRGLIPNSWADISTAVSGYNYFVRDAWTLPLFQASKLGAPDGVNIIFTDSIPIVAVCGRLLYRATGMVVNPYGGWAALCFLASALSMTGLVATLGQRSIAAAVMAAISGLCMPALLYRWGHMSLMAQWELPCALIIYFKSLSSHRIIGVVISALVLAILSLWTHVYLFVMVMGILGAALAQAVLERRVRLLPGAYIAAVFTIMLVGVMCISGHVSNPGTFGADGFGQYSLNSLSPFLPQFSALFPFMGNTIVDDTGGQYEGFTYFGAGILLLAFMTLLRLRRPIAAVWQTHSCLILLMLAFTAFAVSNEIYLGAWHVGGVPLPAPILAIASMFRSGGRFFWPCLYLFTALVIVATPRLWGRAGGWLLVLAALLQLTDTTPLRSALAARLSAPAATPLSETLWADAIQEHNMVRVLPAYLCLSDPRNVAAQISIELQLLASRENVTTNTVYAARHHENCAAPEMAVLGPKELRVYLLSDEQVRMPPLSAMPCVGSSTLAVCSRELDLSDLAALKKISWH
jgi:hypothetical protein